VQQRVRGSGRDRLGCGDLCRDGRPWVDPPELAPLGVVDRDLAPPVQFGYRREPAGAGDVFAARLGADGVDRRPDVRRSPCL